MAVGFGYIRDKKPTQVDWAELSRQAREGIKGIEDDRKERREAIDEAQREYAKTLADYPVGTNTAYNTFMADFSQQASNVMLENLNMLKRGEITEEEFYRRRGNITSGTSGMLAAAKAYSENFDQNALLAQTTGDGFSTWSNGKMQDLMSFQDVRPVIDPESGEITFSKFNEDGSYEIVDITSVFKRSNAKGTRFDLNKAITDQLAVVGIQTKENQFGEIVSGQYVGKDGEVLDEAIRTDAKALLAQPQHVYSVLHDTMGGYSFKDLPPDYYSFRTQEERDAKLAELQADDKILWVDNNNQVLISQTQQDAAEEYVYKKLKNATTYQKKEAEFGKEEKINLELQTQQARIDEIRQSIEKSKADQKFIEARTESEEVTTTDDFKKKLPKIQEYLSNQLAAPVQAALVVGEMFSFTDKDNQVAKTLNNLLSSMGISADATKFLKQSVKIKVPKEDGGTKSVTIDLDNKSGIAIFDEILKQLMLLPEPTLDKLYTRVIDVNQDGVIDVVGSGELD